MIKHSSPFTSLLRFSPVPNHQGSIVFSLLITLMMFSCSDIEKVERKDDKDDKPAQTQTKEVKAIRETQQKVQKHYIGIGKRDPFRSYLKDLTEELKKDDDAGQRRARAVTERFRLEQYRLTALITGTSRPHAMVEDPNGSGHILRIGSRLGRNGGRVTRITGQGVTVTLETSTSGNKKVRVNKTLTLPKADFDLVGQNNR